MKKIKLSLALLLLCAPIAYFVFATTEKEHKWKHVKVSEKSFKLSFQASGTVEPKNRILIMAPVNGRIDRFVKSEGEYVKKGDLVAWMSSADRAALLDMAQASGEEALEKWKKEFQPTPILSPAHGVLIKKFSVTGQTVSPQSKIFEISDKLIVRAEVDETDIGKVKVRQKAELRFDAFPKKIIAAEVRKIAYQSKSSNNVTVYEVELSIPRKAKFLKSGMTATVDFVLVEKEKAIVLPSWIAAGYENQLIDVFVKTINGEAKKHQIRVGSSDGENIEVLEGLNLKDIVMYLPLEIKSKTKSILNVLNRK